MIDYSKPDLTQHPPRSARIRLGGFVILPRMLDKCRAEMADKIGDYCFDCLLDRRFLDFVGLTGEAFKAELGYGRTDAEMLKWICDNAQFRRTAWEIAQWSAFHETWTASSNEMRAHMNEGISEGGFAHREDMTYYFEWLDADDYASFGGPV